jgi:hypothetical protein
MAPGGRGVTEANPDQMVLGLDGPAPD